MKFIASRNMKFSRLSIAWLILLLTALPVFAQAPAPKPSLSAEELEIASGISVDTIKELVTSLSAPEMEGRGTMQSGGDKAAQFIADNFKSLGLKPLGDKGSYLQKMGYEETVLTSETTLKIGEETLNLGSDYTFIPFSSGNKSASGDMVFIAYGIQSDSIKRDDLAGINVSGKIVVMLDGPPANISKEAWEKGNAKFAILGNLIRAGAAGIIYIPHGREKEPNEKYIDYLSRRQLSLESEASDDTAVRLPPFVMLGSKASEKLFANSGVNFKDALAQAERNDFKPFALQMKAEIKAKYKSAKGEASNIIGYLEGSDPVLKEEAIVFTAHYDAYGKDNGKIYHGAADNALGVAEMISVAESYSRASKKPRRSMIFLAVTGEEYGLYGSKYWAKNPTWDIKKVAANLNLDGKGTEIYGPVKTLVGFGAEHSTIGKHLDDVSAIYEIKVIPDPMPDEKIFYRSDHYSFVERGIPCLKLLGAPEGDPKLWMARSKEWEKTDYHQPTDVIKPDWVWEGAQTVATVMGLMGWRISEAEKMPEWLTTSRFAKLERGNTKAVPREK